MLELIPRILLYKAFRKYGVPKILPMNYTVSVLYSCNSRCKTCNIYNKKCKNLTLDEYGKIFKSIGHSPYWVTISGGEPFLRKDLVDICKIIYEYSKPKILNIPTNGILVEKITKDVEEIAKACPDTQLIINLSIDAVGEEHNEIRQVPDNYSKVIQVYKNLRELKSRNLNIGIHTVISKYNVKNFSEIASKLMLLKPDSYITEIAEERNELDTMDTGITPSLVSYRSAIDFLIHRIKNGKFRGMNKITQAFRIEYYDLVKKILRDKEQIIPCYSAIASVQISPDGELWSCCIKAESMGSLREHGYNFKKIWFNSKFDKDRESIKNKECYCPLANASYTNMLMDFPTLLRVFYRSFIKWWS
jgi:MoaA/NifB/PqqE/SkfB family radical SAM enzyme